MIDFSSTRIRFLTIHRVGNQVLGQDCVLANEFYPAGDELENVILEYFLNAFKQVDLKKFSDEKPLDQNEVYAAIKGTFNDSSAFLEQSRRIATHMYECVDSDDVLRGDLLIVYLNEVIYKSTITDGIAIFKLENKEPILLSDASVDGLRIRIDHGFRLEKPDKGCLIVDVDETVGYKMLTLNRKKEDDYYWHRQFLGVTDAHTSREDTQKALDVLMGFSSDVLPNVVQKEEQFEFKNAAVDYFNKKDTFDYLTFKESVLHPFAFENEFQEYMKSRPEEEREVWDDNFEIHKEEVKKAKRQLKSIIKLDTRIEVKLDAKALSESAQFIERGFDEKRQMYFYKVFYNKEIE
jgi:hypothetical protein